jgi:hypothetical protein
LISTIHRPLRSSLGYSKQYTSHNDLNMKTIQTWISLHSWTY